LPAECKLPGRFTKDGYALVLCEDPATKSTFALILSETGEAIHERRIGSVSIEALLYAATP